MSTVVASGEASSLDGRASHRDARPLVSYQSFRHNRHICEGGLPFQLS